MTKALAQYLPSGAVAQVEEWLQRYQCELKITAARQSKWGDYRSPHAGKGHRISINGDLNPYAFLITLTHEIAHMMVWDTHRSRVAPHGKEWKATFRNLLLNFLSLFPDDILRPLSLHLKNPAASSSRDINLQKALRQYDAVQKLSVADIPMGSLFQISNGRRFLKLKKLRKRYQCKAMDNNRLYLFNPLTEVTLC